MLDLKAMLPFLDIEETEGVYDAGVAGYLLNPLKSAYLYDELAAEYLGMTVPSRMDLLGKLPYGKALEEKQEAAVSCFCYQAYAAAQAGPVLLEKLAQTGMKTLFLTIEMPLIYSLYHMEKEGIRVERET